MGYYGSGARQYVASRIRRGGFSGEAQFNFTIERLKCLETGILFHEDDLPKEVLNDTSLYEPIEIPLSIEGNAYYMPGVLLSAPEDCYEDEGDVEISEAVDSDGVDWRDKLSDYEKEIIEEQIVDMAKQDG